MSCTVVSLKFYDDLRIPSNKLANTSLRPSNLAAACLISGEGVAHSPGERDGRDEGKAALDATHGERSEARADAMKLSLGKCEQRQGTEAERDGELAAF